MDLSKAKMVLESLIKPSKMEKSPRKMLWIGFFYSSLGLFLASWIFKGNAGIVSVFLTAMPLIVIMYNVVRYEEEKDLKIHKEIPLLKEHGHALSLFMFLFIGMVISYTFWFTVLPQSTVESLFDFQLRIIEVVNPDFEGIGNVTGIPMLINNLSVLAFCILFSFLYGAGAIFILTLNASVIGVAVGSIIRNSLALYGRISGLEFLIEYFKSFPISFAFMIHGIPEIAAYFFGALGGGIISVAVVNHDYRSREFRHILLDSLDLILLSVLLLVIAWLLEVYVTPLLLQ